MTTEIETEALETDDAGTEVETELDAGAIVEELVADEQAEPTEDPADAGPTGGDDDFEPTEAQVEMAKQLGLSADEIADMTETEAIAYDKVARLDSRRQQRKGKEAVKPKEDPPAGEDSSTDDDEFTEEDWFTDAGRKKINAVLKASKTQSQTQDNTDKQRFQADANKVFDGLDPEAFADFSPGESALIEPGSAAETRRNEVLVMAKSIQAVRDAQGHEVSLKDAIENALVVIAPTETENAASNKANAGRKKRGSQRISAPSTTTGKHKVRQETPEKQAVADTLEELRTG